EAGGGGGEGGGGGGGGGRRNGTFVTGQKIDEARLVEAALLKVGSTEFEFHQSLARPTDNSGLDRTQTVIRDKSVLQTEEPGEFGLDALRANDRAHDFLT